MRNYINTKEMAKILGLRIKAGLQISHKALTRDKYAEKEYKLFIRLGEICLLRGEVYDYPKAAAIYQYTKKLVEKYLNNNPEKLKEIAVRIQNVESVFFDKVKAQKLELKAMDIATTSIKDYVARLQEYREHVRNRLADTEDLGTIEGQEELDEKGLQKRASGVETIYREIREFFIGKRTEVGELTKPGLVNELINDCIRELGGLPKVGSDKHECTYAIFGMGSMALGTMTPWSDLEFGILIEGSLTPEEKRRVKEYFKLLTTLLHIKVINFGESPLRMMGIEELNNFKLTERLDPEHNWFYDDLTRSGFSFDGPHWHACKTPLGRKGFKGCYDYELIGTVNETLKFQQEDKWQEQDIQLVQALCHTVLIIGSTLLLDRYQLQVSEYLLKTDNRSTEAIIGRSRGLKLLESDVEQYNTTLGITDAEGKLYEVKKEIYRLLQTILEGFAAYYSLANSNIWRIIEELQTRSFIKNEAGQNLKIALSIATELRLRTYAANNSQNEASSIFKNIPSKVLEHERQIKEAFHIPNIGILFRFYYTALPLHKRAKELFELSTCLGKSLIIKDNFFDNSNFVKGLVHLRLLQYDKALNVFELVHQVNDKDYITLLFLSFSLTRLGRFKKALIYLNKVPRECVSEKDSETLDISKAKLNECLDNFNEAECIYKDIISYSKSISNIAIAYNGIGVVYGRQGKQRDALKHLAFAINRCTDKKSSLFITITNNMALEEGKRGNYDNAIRSYKRTLKACLDLYGLVHPKTAKIFSNIAAEYHFKFVKGSKEISAKLALEYYSEALRIYKIIFQDINTNEILNVYFNIGSLYYDIKKYSQALHYFQIAKKVDNELNIGREASDLRIRILINLAKCFFIYRKYSKSLHYFQEAKHINIYKELDKIIDNGILQSALKDADELIQVRKIEVSISHNDSAMLHNLACAYHIKAVIEEKAGQKEYAKGNLVKAKETFEKAINMKNVSKSNLCTEYAQFLLKYHNKSNKEEYDKIIKLLQDAINLGDSLGLSYNQLEKPTTCEPLQELLSKQEEISIKPMVLSYYLLIELHIIHSNMGLAWKVLEEFEKQLQFLQIVQDCFIGYYLLEVAHKDIIAATVKEALPIDIQSVILSSNICSLIAEYEGSLSYDKALSFNCEGRVYFKSKDYSKAIIALSKAVGLSFTNPIPEILCNRGRAYYKSNKIDEAMLDYQDLLKVNPNHARAYYQIGVCYRQKGNLLQAETFLKQALETEPKLEVAQKVLEGINKTMSGNLASKIKRSKILQQQSNQLH